MIGGGDVCAALLSLGEESKGGGLRGLGSVGGAVGGKDRVLEVSTCFTQAVTHSYTHTHTCKVAPPCYAFSGNCGFRLRINCQQV